MSTALAPITRQTVGRTFIVAISVLGLGAAAQLAVVSWMFYQRFQTGPALVTNSRTIPASPGGPTVAPALAINDVPFDATGVSDFPEPSTATTSGAQNAVNLSPEEVKRQRFQEQLEHGRILRQRGEWYAARESLTVAQAMNVEMNLNSPEPLAELALTYEKLGFREKAAEAWLAVHQLGEKAGIYFAAADGRLRLSRAEAVKDAQGKLPTAPAAGATSAPAGEKVGLAPESKLGLLELKRREETDPAAARKFTLLVPVRAKPRARIDVREVIVQVLFFDKVNDRALDKTTAQVSYKWSDPPADWSDGDVEQLEVTYVLPNLRVADEDRKYFGYVASVYYKNALQDFRADPPNLVERYAPAKQLSSEPE